jgi:chromosome segregation ATPase
MKHRVVLIIQVLLVLGFGALWIMFAHKSDQEQRIAANQIRLLSNSVSSALSRLDELRAVNLALETNLAARQAQYSNELAASHASHDAAFAQLAKAEADAKTSAEATAAELARLDKQMLDIQAHHQNLDTESADLHNSIADLDGQIQDAKRKLASSTADQQLLTNELAQLQAKEAALVKDFGDLDAVRKQLSKAKADIAAARQYDLVRRGVYAGFNQKGGERLIHPAVALPSNTNATWTVELKQKDSATVTAPDSTNAPLPH